MFNLSQNKKKLEYFTTIIYHMKYALLSTPAEMKCDSSYLTKAKLYFSRQRKKMRS